MDPGRSQGVAPVRIGAFAALAAALWLGAATAAGASVEPASAPPGSFAPMAPVTLEQPIADMAPEAPAAEAEKPATANSAVQRRAEPSSQTAKAAAEAREKFGLSQGQTADVLRIALVLTLLTLLPAIAVCMTPFIRIAVVLSIIRHAFGMPETPPNQVLVGIALFVTCFIMAPTLTQVNQNALQPFLNNTIPMEAAMAQGSAPLKDFMLRQVHDQDLKAVYEIGRRPLPASKAEVGLMELTTAFMLNELRVAFKIGFVILLPFLLIDLVVSSVLLALGMMMVPPSTLSLPIKVLMFVLIDGWTLILTGVAAGFR